MFLIDLVDFPYEFDLIKKVIELAETPLDEREADQLVFVKKDIIELEQVEEISNNTNRGTGGFGSTGRF